MKTNKIIYWTATAIIAVMMVFSAYAYLANPAIAQAFQHIGFPGYFRVELAIGKLIGAVLLLTPVSARIKEWVYAGFGITFISAFIAHTVSGDPVTMKIATILFLAILIVSYVTYHRLAEKNLKIATT